MEVDALTRGSDQWAPHLPGIDPKERFSRRAEYYAKYRPNYPATLLKYLKSELSLSRKSIVADVGSGTGILSEIFLKNGNIVFGIEPNEDMRRLAERNLSAYRNFRSVNGSAESMEIPGSSVDFITAAQSFHWFDKTQAKTQFRRVLKDGGWVVLIWNTRKKLTPFLRTYNNLVKEWNIVERRYENLSSNALHDFLGDYRKIRLPNHQDLDFDGLVGRIVSASYAPFPGERKYDQMMTRLHPIFDKYQVGGRVRVEYETEVYAGQL